MKKLVALFACLLSVSSASAQFAPAPSFYSGQGAVDSKEAKDSKKQVFDFGYGPLNFETLIPSDAEVKAVNYEYQAIGADEMARVRIIANMKFAAEKASVNYALLTYQTEAPVSPERICLNQMRLEGYQSLMVTSPKPKLVADISGRSNDGKKMIFGHCVSRQDILEAHFFTVNMPEGIASRDKAAQSAFAKVATFVNNIHYADGNPASHAAAQTDDVIMETGNGIMIIPVPSGFEISIQKQSDDGKQSELQIIRKRKTGEIASAVGMIAEHEVDPKIFTSSDDIALKLASFYVNTQIKPRDPADKLELRPEMRTELKDFAVKGATATSYSFALAKVGDTKEVILRFHLTLIGNKTDLYTVFYTDNVVQPLNMTNEFSRLPGAVAYDTLIQTVYNTITAE